MFFKSSKDSACLATLLRPDLNFDSLGELDVPWPDAMRISFDDESRASIAVARDILSISGDFRSALLWIREYGIWPSSEDLNLYYRLKLSYLNSNELSEEPGHHFLSHEKSDAETFLALAIQFGWGGVFITNGTAGLSLAFSHDGLMRIITKNEAKRTKIISKMKSTKIEI